MPATVKTGMIDTEDILSNERVVDMSERMYKLQPDEQQFRVMLSQIGDKEATREIIEWLEDEYLPRVSSLAASVAAVTASTTLTVTTGHGNTVFGIGDVVRNMESGEAYLVTAQSANSIAVTRSWGSVAAASSSSAGILMIVGNAAAQGASSAIPRVVQRVRAFNYVQEQRNDLFFSLVQTAIELYGGREPAKEIAKKMVEHGRSLENTLFWGARDFDTAASPGPMGSCGGAIEFISTYVSSATGALAPAEFDTFLEGPFGFGSKNKVIFCAPRVGTVLSQMLRDVWQPNTVGERKFGAKVDAFISGTYGWTIPIFVKREWQDLGASTLGQTDYGSYLFLIDMDYVRKRPLRGLNTHLRRNIQEPSATAVAHEVYTAQSLEFAWEKCHGILKGITSYSAT